MWLCAALTLLMLADPQSAPVDGSSLDVSVRRISSALEKPAGLRIVLPPIEPTFRVEVQAHPFYADVPIPWDFSGGGVPTAGPQSRPTGAAPLATVDILPLIRAAMHARAEAAAKAEVKRVFAEFCETHACDPH